MGRAFKQAAKRLAQGERQISHGLLLALRDRRGARCERYVAGES